MKTLFVIVILSLVLASAAFADRDRGFRRGWHDRVRGNERSLRPPRMDFRRPGFAGNGCPEGTMQAVFAPDNLSFSILFDKFVAEVSGQEQGRGGRRDVMSCDINLPLTIPEGMQMEITRVDYRGFVGIPQGARANLSAVLNFMERRGGDRSRINVRYNFAGPLAENYEISSGALNDDGQSQATELSPCGGEVQLRIRNQLQIVAPPRQQASLTLDSIDGSANAVYYVNWRACQVAPPPPPPPVRPGPGPGHGPGGFPGRGGFPGFPGRR